MVPNKLPAQEVVEKWSEASFDDEADAVSSAKRAQVIARMELRLEQTIAEVDSGRRRARSYAALGCAAALCLSAFGAWRWNRARLELGASNASAVARVDSVQGSVSVTRGGLAGVAAAPVTGDTKLGPGDDVVTAPDGRTHVELADGVSIMLGAASHLSLPKTGAAEQPQLALGHEQIRLDEGIVTVKVPHLTQGHTFAVKTPDTEVTVHGTAFTVEVGEYVSADQPLRSGGHASDATVATRVRVTEGVVSVTNDGREVFLHAGMQWVSQHAELVQQPPTPAVAGAFAPTSLAPAVASATPVGALPQKPVANSTLAEQTRLLEAGMTASKSGDYSGAVASLNELLRRYPGTGLAPEAHVQLFRALAGAHDYAAAAREARRYLAAYPDGYAHEEAKKLALEH